MRIKRQINQNEYVFAIVTRVIGIALGFVYTIVLSRYLGASLRGEYSIIQNYANIFAAVIGVGIYQAYPYYKKRTEKDKQYPLYLDFSKNIVGLFLVYEFIAVLLVLLLPVNYRIKAIIGILPLAYLYKEVNYLVLIEKPRLSNLADMFLGIFDIAFVCILMCFTRVSLFWCLVFLVVEKIAYGILPVINLRINFLKHKPIVNKNCLEYAKYGFVPMLTILLMTFNYKVDIVMLSLYKNVTSSDIGIYSLGVLLVEKVWMLPDVLTNVLQSKLAKGKNEQEVARISRICVWITAMCLALMLIVGKPLILFAYGKEYASAYDITAIILLGVLGMVFYKVVYAYNIVAGKRKVNFILLLLSVLLNVILNAFLIFFYGTVGAGIASLISFSACGIAFLLYFTNTTKIPIKDMIIIQRDDIKAVKKFISKRKPQSDNSNKDD